MPIVGLGVDLVEAQRVERLIARNEDIFRSRILGPDERMEIPASAGKQQRVLAYAWSIAAKEAFLKALGTGLTTGMRWPDVQVVRRAGARPTLAVNGETARVLAGFGAAAIELSLAAVGVSAGPRRSSSQVMATVVITRSDAHETSL